MQAPMFPPAMDWKNVQQCSVALLQSQFILIKFTIAFDINMFKFDVPHQLHALSLLTHS